MVLPSTNWDAALCASICQLRMVRRLDAPAFIVPLAGRLNIIVVLGIVARALLPMSQSHVPFANCLGYLVSN